MKRKKPELTDAPPEGLNATAISLHAALGVHDIGAVSDVVPLSRYSPFTELELVAPPYNVYEAPAVNVWTLSVLMNATINSPLDAGVSVTDPDVPLPELAALASNTAAFEDAPPENSTAITRFVVELPEKFPVMDVAPPVAWTP
jgi:hypothetical protein